MFLCGSKEGGKVKCFRIVLLGNVASGKTTFCKQIVDSYLGGFSRSMKKEFRKHIQANILHRLVVMKSAGNADLEAVLAENEETRRQYQVLEDAAVADFDYTDDETLSYVAEVLEAANHVGNLPVVQEMVKNEFYSAPWDFMYFKSIGRIFSKDYEPSKEDIFTCRKPTTGICEYVIKHLQVEGEGESKKTKEVWIEFVDVGGTSPERKRWESILQNSDGIFYFIAMTDFAEPEKTSAGKNDHYSYLNHGVTSNISLKYSTNLFERIFSTRKTSGLPIVLILTKQDLFNRMVTSGDVPLTKCLGIDFTGEGRDSDQATGFLVKTLVSAVKMNLRGLELYSKMDKMPIMHWNMVLAPSFAMNFNTLWGKMELMIEEMKTLKEKILQNDVKTGRLKNFSVIKKISMFGGGAKGLKKTLSGSRVAPRESSIHNWQMGENGNSNREAGERQKNAVRNRSLLRKPSFESYSSATELVSGDNISVVGGKYRGGKRLSATAILKGIRRTKSYHWN